MTITWLGHACFHIEEDGYAVVLDPYTGVTGYPPLAVSANEVLCSHGHGDHNYTDAVMQRENLTDSPFTVEAVETFHDEKQGTLRGRNTVRVLRCGAVSVVHLGDLGHMLSPTQCEALAGCDVLMIPVGGVYTINAVTAKQVVEQIHPRIVVPMHYRHAPYGLENIGGVEAFLELFPDSTVQRLNSNSFSPDGLQGVVVPRYPV